jgi:hypothetical protein
MSDASLERRWRVLLTPRWISWHLFAVAAVVGMMWLGDWQFRRAMAGNTLSWAYTFEWPIFAIFGVVFWTKTVRDELHPPASQDAEPAEIDLPAGTRPARASGEGGTGPRDAGQSVDARAGTPEAGPDDAELAEYNAYLAKLSRQVKGHGRWHGLR